MLKKYLILLFYLKIILFPNICKGSEQNEKLSIPKVEGNIFLDGDLSEDIWKKATKVELEYETSPGENVPATIKTTAYIAENSDSLLIAFIAEDPEPKKIQSSLKARDTAWSDDRVGFKIDPFNNQRKAYAFFVNPIGVQIDALEDDVAGSADVEWNGIWYSEGKITDKGYQVEIRIPFKVFRFEKGHESKTWGVDFYRYYPRKFRYRYAYSKVDRSISCVVCPIGEMTGFENIESGNNIEVSPYLSTLRSDSRNPFTNSEWQNGDVDNEGGVDFRWGITDSSLLNLSINPDFSQVESDVIQLDVNTNFALFFQEKRALFVEGADYFKTPLDLLYTRNIADPNYALKYTGKASNHLFGALIASDQTTNYLLPGSQSARLRVLNGLESYAGVFRYVYEYGDRSQIGAMYTHREGENYKNSVFAIDGKYQINNYDRFTYQLLHSNSVDPVADTDGSTSSSASESGFGYFTSYEHISRNWYWSLERTEFDNEFRADLGFIDQVGYENNAVGLRRTWYGESSDIFSRIRLSADIDVTHDYSDQKLDQEAEITLQLNGKYQSSLLFTTSVADAWYADLRLNSPDTPDIPRECVEGCWFDQIFYGFSGSFRPVNSLQIGGYYNFGDAVDFAETRAAERVNYGFWANWQITPKWYVLARTDKSILDIPEGNLIDAHTVNASSTYQFDKQQYLRLTVRYRSVDNSQMLFEVPRSSNVTQMSKQILYAYTINPRTVFFLGYSDGGFENDNVTQFERTGRTIFSKFSYAFQF